MKRKFALALSLAVSVVMGFTGCGVNKDVPKIKNVSDLGGKTIAMLATGTPKDIVNVDISNNIGYKPRDVLYFNRFSDAIAATTTGKSDATMVSRLIAEYYVKRNNALTFIKSEKSTQEDIIMAVRSEDKELKDNLDRAIKILQENGTTKTLEDTWITDLPVNNEPVAKEIPKIESAKTIFVGVCGDIVPLDYIAADGRPAGYNIALLTEISKLLNVNFEFVSLEYQARFVALNAKKIDLIFVHRDIKGRPANQTQRNEDWIGTIPYYKTESSYFLVKK